MPVAVPDVITTYFASTDSADADALVACFTDDAVVVDEGRTRRGRAEIRQWRDEIAQAFEYTATILDVESDDAAGSDGYVVTARVEGNFPGNVVDLKNRFRLRHGLIAHLEIAP